VWWSNDVRHTQAKSGWLAAGWIVEKVNFEREEVALKKTHKGEGALYKSLLTPFAVFERTARKILSEHFGVPFFRDILLELSEGVYKTFDLVSGDGKIVGEIMFLSGGRSPTSRFSLITERAWLLEKVKAQRKFIAFGNDIIVPKLWLQRYGKLIKDIEFYFIDENKKLLIKLE